MTAIQKDPTTGGADVAPLFYSRPDACAMLGGIGNTKFYELVKAGRLRIVKLGTRTLVSAAELQRFAAEVVQEGGE